MQQEDGTKYKKFQSDYKQEIKATRTSKSSPKVNFSTK